MGIQTKFPKNLEASITEIIQEISKKSGSLCDGSSLSNVHQVFEQSKNGFEQYLKDQGTDISPMMEEVTWTIVEIGNHPENKQLIDKIFDLISKIRLQQLLDSLEALVQ